MKEMAIKIRTDGRDIKKIATCDLAMVRYGGQKEKEANVTLKVET